MTWQRVKNYFCNITKTKQYFYHKKMFRILLNMCVNKLIIVIDQISDRAKIIMSLNAALLAIINESTDQKTIRAFHLALAAIDTKLITRLPINDAQITEKIKELVGIQTDISTKHNPTEVTITFVKFTAQQLRQYNIRSSELLSLIQSINNLVEKFHQQWIHLICMANYAKAQ